MYQILKNTIQYSIFVTTGFISVNLSAFEFIQPSVDSMLVTKINSFPNKGFQKKVSYMTIKLTKQEKKVLFSYDPRNVASLTEITNNNLPSAVNLGMNNVPVLDQGYWPPGACVTFANTVAIDAEGNKHQGLLLLRNSRGQDVGDHGNFYMTYDYFKKFVLEVQEIASKKN